MKVQVLYDLLKELKNDKKNYYYESTLRLFDFVYDVNRSFNKEKENSGWGDRINHVLGPLVDVLPEFIDGEKSILIYFDELIRDGKDDFISSFFGEMDNYFAIADKNLFSDKEFDKRTIIFNIYLLLKFYHENKNDLETYRKLIKDFSFLIQPGDLSYKTSSIRSSRDDYFLCLNEKKKIIDKIIEINSFEEIPYLTKSLIEFIKNIGIASKFTGKYKAYVELLPEVEKVMNGAKEFREKYPDFDISNALKIVGRIFKSYEYNLNDVVRLKSYFYAPVLLFGNRYEYIEKCNNEIVGNTNFMEEFVSIMSNMDNSFFDRLNEKNIGNDSFITYMDKVFDSDTFYEIKKKLVALTELTVSDLTQDEIDRVLDSLDTDDYKLEIADIKVKYNDKSINLNNFIPIYERQFKAINFSFSGIVSSFSYDEYCGLKRSENTVDAENINFVEWIKSTIMKRGVNVGVVKNLVDFSGHAGDDIHATLEEIQSVDVLDEINNYEAGNSSAKSKKRFNGFFSFK